MSLEEEFEERLSQFIKELKNSPSDVWIREDEFRNDTLDMIELASGCPNDRNTLEFEINKTLNPPEESQEKYEDWRRNRLLGFVYRIQILVSPESVLAHAAESLVKAHDIMVKNELFKYKTWYPIWKQRHKIE